MIMADISALLEKGCINRASTKVYDAFRYLINTKLPNTELSRDEFDMLMPLVVDKIKNKTVPTDKTPDPGDDIDIERSKAWLVISSVGPDDLKVPTIYIQPYAVGADYEYEIPQFEGYVTDLKVIKGKMGIHNVHIVVEYKKNPDEVVEPLYGRITVKKDNKNKSTGYIDSRDLANIQIVEAGTYYNDTFLNSSDESAGIKAPAVTIKDAWWPAVVLHAPETMTTDDVYNAVQARYYNTKKGEWVYFSLGDTSPAAESEKSAYPEDKQEKKSYIWLPVVVSDLKYPNGSDGFYHQLIQVDWNKDGFYEQSFDIAINTNAIKLYDDKENENMIWPEEY